MFYTGMDRGEYFFLKSSQTGLVVTAGDSGEVKMQAVEAVSGDRQLWYLHEQTLTLRTRLNAHCVYCVDGLVGVRQYEAGCTDVCRWQIKDNVLHLTTPSRVLSTDTPHPGATLTISTYTASPDQHWQLHYIEPPYFYIRSLLSPRVLDVKAGEKSAGTKVITWKQTCYMQSNLLWFTDKNGTIRSKLNNFSLDVADGSCIVMMPADASRASQQWRFEDSYIVNHSRPGEVLDICANKAQDGAEILSYKKHGGKNQQWVLVYV